MLSTQNQDQGKNVRSIPSYLYILASEIRQSGEKGRQLGRNTDWKKRKTMSLFTDDIMKYILHT